MQSEANLCLVDQGHCFVWRSFSVEEKYLSYETGLKIIGSQNKEMFVQLHGCAVFRPSSYKLWPIQLLEYQMVRALCRFDIICINLVQTVAPDWVTDGSGLDYNTYDNRIGYDRWLQLQYKAYHFCLPSPHITSSLILYCCSASAVLYWSYDVWLGNTSEEDKSD